MFKIQNDKIYMEAIHQEWESEDLTNTRSKALKPSCNGTTISNKTRVPTLITVTQHSFGSPSHGNQRRKKKIKGIWIGKKVKLFCLQTM